MGRVMTVASTPGHVDPRREASLIGPILHVMWTLQIGGAERAVYQLVREQRRAGIQADVLLGKGGGLYAAHTRETGAMVHEVGLRRAFDLRRLRGLAGVF